MTACFIPFNCPHFILYRIPVKIGPERRPFNTKSATLSKGRALGAPRARRVRPRRPEPPRAPRRQSPPPHTAKSKKQLSLSLSLSTFLENLNQSFLSLSFETSTRGWSKCSKLQDFAYLGRIFQPTLFRHFVTVPTMKHVSCGF